MYEDNTTDKEGGLSGNTEDNKYPIMVTGLDRKVPTPEVNDNYVNYSAIFTRGDSYARGKIIGQKRDADGNYVGRTNYNPMLDKRVYLVEFDDGEVSELTENVISDSMYAAFNDSINEYLIMDSIVEYHKSDKPYHFLVRRWCIEVGASCVNPHLDYRYASNGEMDQCHGKLSMI